MLLLLIDKSNLLQVRGVQMYLFVPKKLAYYLCLISGRHCWFLKERHSLWLFIYFKLFATEVLGVNNDCLRMEDIFSFFLNLYSRFLEDAQQFSDDILQILTLCESSYMVLWICTGFCFQTVYNLLHLVYRFKPCNLQTSLV